MMLFALVIIKIIVDYFFVILIVNDETYIYDYFFFELEVIIIFSLF